jgi:hypothetical protein
VTALELARKKLSVTVVVVRESEKSAVSPPAGDHNSLNSHTAQTCRAQKPEPTTDLSSLCSLTAQHVEQPERGAEKVFGLSDAWLARLKRRAARGDTAAAKEAVESGEYLLKCDRGEIEIPPHPKEQALIEWNRLCGERANNRSPTEPRGKRKKRTKT